MLRYQVRLALAAGLLMLLGFLKEGVLGIADLLLSMGAALLMYFFARTFTWITLTTEGIEGAMQASGGRTRLDWQDNLVVRRTSYIGLQCIDLVTLDGSQSIRVPTEITRSSAFQRAVSELAPPGHPLRRLSKSSSANDLKGSRPPT
ncbi:hypothetical protein [Paucibacter sp. M5-1]|uniref:hypothetical protein n=1 Tax=Paucibacter sp. M5-1 TaxID=3015998 RepID=UPI003F7FAA31